ncbi:hypothetical protein J3E72DRAFT_384558 [Bipolaris maydis]|nr:hypothetical protein BM1_02221 [Bipolaris maydis]KAJ5062859.1 hypothetical protein J3E74DRAFT_473040 [Bipolaris maydis]KAJ6199132.1 hypothetical protein J3E72DRAFT_384558 [Bipolaris maydis]KAJ6283393.1 hypothetical protein J3E71DRAFT_195429 [Bipolaris maydis]
MGVPSDLAQLQRPLRFLQARSQKKQDEVARLKRELAEAEAEAKSVKADYLKTIIYYARTDCLQLANMMYEKLPAELREMVYEYLCVDADRPIPVGPYYHFHAYNKPYVYPAKAKTEVDAEPDLIERLFGKRSASSTGSASGAPGNSAPVTWKPSVNWGDELQIDPELVERVSRLCVDEDEEEAESDSNYTILPDGRVKEKHTHKPPSDMMLPSSHFLDPRYVGPLVSHETQKVYYARNTFSVCNVENALANFLGRDTCSYHREKWEDDLAPTHSTTLEEVPPLFAADHIRHLQIRLKFEHFRNDLPARQCFLDRYAYEQRFLRTTWGHLEGLKHYLERRPKGKIEIEFIIMTKLSNMEHVAGRDEYNNEVLDRDRCFMNFLQCMRNMVYKAMYDHEDTLVKVTHYDARHWIFPRDITGVFGLTAEQWEYEKSKQGGQHDWVGDFFVMQQDAGLRGLPGVYDDELEDMVWERWGMATVFEKVATEPVKAGRFWPVVAKT